MSVNFDPDDFNGELGSVVAIAGEDYAVIGGDTRHAKYFTLVSRDQTKLFPMGERAVLGAVGVRTDVLGIARDARAEMINYEISQGQQLKMSAMGNMLGMMISKRVETLSYAALSVLAGLDEDEGRVLVYDPFGRCLMSSYIAVGSAAQVIQVILNSQINAGGVLGLLNTTTSLPLKSAVNLMRDVFGVASERDVYTGDTLQISVITQGGIKQTSYPLRAD